MDEYLKNKRKVSLRREMKRNSMCPKLPDIYRRKESIITATRPNVVDDISADDICDPCKKLLQEFDEGNMEPDEGAPTEVASALHKLQNAYQKRSRADTEGKLKDIMSRITDALQHSGMDGPVVIKETHNNPPFSFQKKPKYPERDVLDDLIRDSETTMTSRKAIIIELKSWLDTLKIEWDKVCLTKPPKGMSNEDFQQIIETFDRSSEAISRVEELFKQGIKLGKSRPKKKKRLTPPPVNPVRSLMKFTESEKDVTALGEEGESTISLSEIETKVMPPVEIPTDLDDFLGSDHIRKVCTKVAVAFQNLMDPKEDKKKQLKVIRKQFKRLNTTYEKKEQKISDLDEELEKLVEDHANQKTFYEQQKEVDAETITQLKTKNDEIQEKLTDVEQKLAESANQPPSNMNSYNEFRRSSRTSSRRTTIQVDSNASGISRDVRKRRSNRMSRREKMLREFKELKGFKDLTDPREDIPDADIPPNPKVSIQETNSIGEITSLDPTNPITFEADLSTESVVPQSAPGTADITSTDNITSTDTVNLDDTDSLDAVNPADTLAPEQKGPHEHRRYTIPIGRYIAQSFDSISDMGSASFTQSEDSDQDLAFTIIDELKTQLGDMENELNIANNKISTQEEQIASLENANKENFLQIVAMTADFQLQEETIEAHSRKIKKLEEELEKEKLKYINLESENLKLKKDAAKYADSGEGPTRAQTLTRVEQEWKTEVQTMRDHMEKEKQRYKAQIRQNQLDSKRTENIVRQDYAATLRALYRFKRVIDRFLNHDGEINAETLDEAQLELLKGNQGDSFEIQVSQTATEMLLNLEQNLARILLTKNIEMKETNVQKVNAMKDLKLFKRRFTTTAELCEKQEQFVKMTANQNTLLINAYQKLLLKKEWQSHIPDSQPAAILPADAPTETVPETDTLDSVTERRVRMKETPDILEPPFNPISTSYNMKKQLINIALETDQITLIDYERANDIIMNDGKISKDMLIWFIRRYNAMKHMENMKRLINSIEEEEYKDDARVKKFLLLLENRYQNKLTEFELSKAKLRKKREDSVLKLGNLIEKNVLGGLSVETYTSDEIKSVAPVKMQKNAQGVAKRFEPIAVPPSKLPVCDTIEQIIGVSMKKEQIRESYWMMPPDNMTKRFNRLTVPRLLDLDVNQWKKCIEKPKDKNGRGRFVPSIASFHY